MIPLDELPPDPFPDLTLIDLDRLKPTPELEPLRIYEQLHPDEHVVLLAKVVERTPDGAPRFVRIVP